MKTLIALIFFLVIGVTAQAQNPNALVKVRTISICIVIPAKSQEITVKNENGVAVIYIYKNAKIKKALSFTTTNDKSKLS